MKFTLAALVLISATNAVEVEGYPDHLGEMFQTRSPCTETTGTSIRNLDNSWSTATFTNLRTGSELASASTPGSAEVPDNAKAKDGATVTTHVRRSMSEMPEGHSTQVK